MASMWNKTLFYLGLVDEDEQGVDAPESVGDVRPVTPQPPPAQALEPH